MEGNGFEAMNVAYEILSSVFGYFPTEEGYEDIIGNQQRHMISDSAIIKQWNEFTHRDDEHQYMVVGEQKDARYTAAQWELGHKNRPIEETYWALDVGTAFHDILDNNTDTAVKIMDIVCGNGKHRSGRKVEEDLLKRATSPFTSVLDDDIRNSDWYDTLLVPLPDNMGGPIHFGPTYDELESLYEAVAISDSKYFLVDDLTTKLFHAVMQFPIPINKTDYQGYIAVMPYEKGSISFSNMALLEITESGSGSYSLGQLSPSFGEEAFKKWEELRPDIRYQSINKRII
jgi:hypothetical protein